MTTIDKSSIADLVAKYGSSSATAWLEFERYKLWQPTEPVPESTFTPVQGYMEKSAYIFAWGNPLVSDPAALPNVARQFIHFCESQGKRPVWSCVDRDLEEVLGSDEFGWSTASCIYEDVVDPAHVMDLTSPESKGQEGQKVIKDLKKNLYRAEKYNVTVKEILANEWTDDDKIAIEQGIRDWKENKRGVQIASTTLQPWLDSEHRRYWVAKQEGDAVGTLILTPIQASSWQIKNAVSFPKAPKGTSEALIYTALKDLHEEQERALANGEKIPHPANGNFHGGKIQPVTTENSSTSSISGSESDLILSSGSSTPAEESPTPAGLNGSSATPSASDLARTPTTTNGASSNGTVNGHHKDHSPPPQTTSHRDENRVTVTFGISASNSLEPIHNLGGWKVSALSKTYGKVAKGARLIQRGEFRSKFDSAHDPMYVCYPPDGFGLDGVNALLKVLRK